MNKKNWFRKNWFAITFITVLLLGLSSLGVINAAQKGYIDKLPALMDAKGKIELTVGDFKLEKQPYLGDPNAQIKVIEFFDFKCPACAKWDKENFSRIKQEYIDPGKVQFYAINFPFLGPDSIEAALAAESVYKQSPEKYWEFQKGLFNNQGEEGDIWATESYILNFVKKNIKGIDMDLLKRDLKEHTYLLDVKEDFKISAANGVYGTPTFIVNGVKVGGSYDEMKAVIDKLLK